MHLQGNPTRRWLTLALTALFCAFTAAQMTRPLLFLTPGRTASLTTRHHNFTRHTIEEVGDKAVDIAAASGRLMLNLPIVEREREHTPKIAPDEADATEWTSDYKFHRRNPPPSLDDSN